MVFNIKNNGDIELKQGDSDILEFAFTDENQNPIDLANSTLYFSVKSLVDDANYFFQKVTTEHTDPGNGKTEVSVDSDDTASYGTYLYDCVLVFANGVRDSFFPDSKAKTGKFIINRGVTNV